VVDVEARVLRGDQVVADAKGKFLKVGPLDLESIFGSGQDTEDR